MSDTLFRDQDCAASATTASGRSSADRSGLRSVAAALSAVNLQEELVRYRERVIRLRLENLPDTIYNSSSLHAAVQIEQLFLAAKTSVKIVCRQLNPTSYGNPLALKAAEAFLGGEGGGTISIFTADIDEGDSGNPFVRRFADDARVMICKAAAPTKFDFMVVDGRAYRYEPDADDSVARASFNDPATAAQLDRVFTALECLVNAEQLEAHPISASV